MIAEGTLAATSTVNISLTAPIMMPSICTTKILRNVTTTTLLEDDSSEPIVFATVKHSKKGNVVSRLHDGSHQSRKNDLYDLNRGHSRSEEGLLKCNESDGGKGRSKVSKINHGSLYKTTSLNRSLAFSEEDIVLGVPRGPKRAVSSSQLPSKGILKNKENNNDIRKAKSMEVLSPRVNTGEGQSGQTGKGITQAEIEQARANFVHGKLQFSAFLDEITKQVMSPSQLSIFGVSPNKTTEKMPAPVPKPELVKPELPPKKHRSWKQSDTELPVKQPSRQVKPTIGSRKHSDCSDSEKLTTYAARKHPGSPPPRHYTPSASHERKDRRPSPTGDSMSGDRYGRYGPHTDGTSTSPEPTQPKQRHQHRHHPSNLQNQNPQIQHFPLQMHHEAEHRGPSNSPPSLSQAAAQGFGSESSSTKSDSSRGQDTASTATSHSSEQSSRHQPQHMGTSKQHRNKPDISGPHLWSQSILPSPISVLRALQEENADLHQNLLQTVVCIESLEAELQRTRDELGHPDLLICLCFAPPVCLQSESLSSERKYLLNRVSQLGLELNDAHRTIAALEDINVSILPSSGHLSTLHLKAKLNKKSCPGKRSS
ncbi:hypothetical protein GOODEAATRI_014086 [Goodea atripinnis]|uniref:Uncharacterized protein n=1 Tax=Goodea atripinnis TaxID=208336 RepID=A0ABV0P551_9TELE